ncbi:MAG: TRAP transporter large permease [Dehalococcoidia bacterium]|nr:MAG: TRAP transporter large permease [Dehalococcoidia bacterium]
MSPEVVGLIGFVIMFALLACGLQIGFAMAIVSFLGIGYIIAFGPAVSKMGISPFDTVTSYELAVLPLFLLMANIIFASGLGKDLYRLAAKWLGHQPGGLAMATVGGCAGFAAVSASSLATALTMGLVALPEMKEYKYDPRLATGSIAAGGTIGILIPPSGVLILYGIITETSIGRLFAGGMIPGILEAVFYMITIYILCWRNPLLGPRGPKTSLKEKVFAFKDCGEIIALIILVLGGLIIGWFTPTEAGAVGAFGAIVFSLLRRRLNWQNFKHAVEETVKLTGMVYVILIGAMLFKYFMAATKIPFMLADFVGGLGIPSMGIMVIIILIYVILGCFLDAAAMVMLTIPIFLPLVDTLGFNLIWFGIIVVRMAEIGLITPPIGLICYNIAAVSDGVPVQTVFRGIIPFLIADILHVLLLLFVPGVVLFLPNLFY